MAVIAQLPKVRYPIAYLCLMFAKYFRKWEVLKGKLPGLVSFLIYYDEAI